MEELNYLAALELLRRFYPSYHTSDWLILAEDIVKWINGEFTEDNSALVYLKQLYNSPAEALADLWDHIQLIAGPYFNNN